MDPVSDIFAAYDNSPTKLARATGLKVQTVHDWRAKTPINIPDWRRQAVLSAVLRDKKEVRPETIAYLSQQAAA